jgi:hypothetical protein
LGAVRAAVIICFAHSITCSWRASLSFRIINYGIFLSSCEDSDYFIMTRSKTGFFLLRYAACQNTKPMFRSAMRWNSSCDHDV